MIYRCILRLLPVVLLLACLDPIRAQQQVETTARQKHVEHGLVPAIRLNGRAPITWNLVERMQRYQTPGISIAVLDGGEIVWAKGYGVREQGKTAPVTTETRFQAGSASPVGLFTALQQVQQRTLELDDDLALALKTWKLPEREVTETQKVTLRTLLSHSAGLLPIGRQGYAPDSKLPTPLEMLEGVDPAINVAIDVAAVPGVRANGAETSSDLMVLQRVLEDVMGKPYAEIAQQTVLSPLNLGHSGYTDPDRRDDAADIASGHVDGERLSHRWHCYPGVLEQQLWTTPTDLASLMQEIVHALTGKSEKLLSPALARQIILPQVPGQGLGFEVHGAGKDLKLLLTGGSDGYYTAIVLYPEKGQGAVIMTNGQRSEMLVQEVLRGLAAEYGWPEAGPKERVPVQAAPQKLALYEGWYGQQTDTTNLLHVWREGESLFAHLSGSPVSPAQDVALFPLTATGRFCYLEDELVFTFLRDYDGNVSGLTVRRGDDTWYIPRLKTPPIPLLSPPVDPDPKRTARLRGVIVTLGRSPQIPSDFSSTRRDHTNELIPLGVPDLQLRVFVFLRSESIPLFWGAEWLTYRIQRGGKTHYYRFAMTAAGQIDNITEIYPVW